MNALTIRRLCLLALVAVLPSFTARALTVQRLTCEYHENPLGVGETHPRLTWTLASARRGEVQTAYRILVASRPDLLARGIGDLWDTGRAASSETALVPYLGHPLKSRQAAYWSVRSWDREGRSSRWSRPARWTMGLLNPSDWKAQWVSAPPAPPDVPAKPNPFAGLSWVWAPGEDALSGVPVETRYFRQEFEIPEGRSVASARFLLSADDRFTLYVNGHEAGHGGLWSHPETVSVGPLLHPGRNVLALSVTNNGAQAGLLGRLTISFETGPPLHVPVDASWRVSSAGPEGWEQPSFDASAWPKAARVAAVGEGPWGIPGQPRPIVLPPSPYLRTSFRVARPVRRATLYVTALGLYEAHLNGRRVGDLYFAPGWTDYRKRLYYQTYDVTHLLRPGRNALGAILAGGWASGYVAFGRRDLYGVGRPRLRAQLEIEYTDGTRQTVGTGPAWRASYGPIREADILMGETYDARRKMPGWDTPTYSDAGWRPVEVRPDWRAPLQAYIGEPVRRFAELAPVRRTQPRPGMTVYDLGQNMDGWARLRVRGPRGARVTLRFGEMLNPDGTVYTGNLRTARATDAYILRGGGPETWEPRFTYHGFRYVEVTGMASPPQMLRGVAVSSFTRPAGSFTSSDPVLNRLWKNIVWTQRDNDIEIPTGCAQRDERLGWTGDAQLFARTSTTCMDAGAFLSKWLVDLRDGQLPSGAFPDVAPDVMGGGGSSGWSDAGLVIPWTLYQVYGDKDALRRSWPAMERWMAAQEQRSRGLLGPASGYGDWLSVGETTPTDVISTAWFAHGAALMARMARALGRPDDARRYEDLFGKVRDAFVQTYVAPDGSIRGASQTGYCLALAYGLLPPSQRDAAARHLLDDVRAHGDHLTTGFLGSALLAPVLTRAGRPDLAYRVVTQPTFPGWGYTVRLGATTLWERWDSWTPETGFADPGMNSFNHFAFGSVGEWLVRDVGGLDTDPAHPGFRRILIHPRPSGGPREARVTYDSIRGPVAVHWVRQAEKFLLDVRLPANTTALVTLPAGAAKDVTESGRPAAASGARWVSSGGGEATFLVGSGAYRFSACTRPALTALP